MKRVLVIDEALPHPPDSGKRIRTWELLTRLAKSFHITLAYHDEGNTAAESVEAARDAGIEPLPVRRKPLKKSGLRFAWDLLRNIPKSVPYMVMAHATKSMQEAIRAAHERTPFDLLHVEWTPLAANIPPGIRRPVCISAHNVESDIWRRYFENERSFFRRRYIGLQWKKVRRYERAALRVAGAVTAVSDKDAQHIRQWTGNESVVTVPNGVNASYFAPDPNADVNPDELCFVGSLDWRPNLDAVTWFLDEVWAPLRLLRPGVRLTVVGRNPPAWLTERAEGIEGIAVHGNVPDVRPFVRRAAISIVPLRIGGGSRLKIPEALAMERPVVSTTVGAEGLDLADGIVLADGAEAFAKAIADTQANPAAAKARALKGRQLALASHEWGHIAPIQAEVWSRLGTPA